MAGVLVGWLWDSSFWYPENITWETLEDVKRDGYVLAEGRDLYISLPICAFLLVIRYVYEKFAMYPLGKQLGIPTTVRKKAPRIPELEKQFALSSKPPSRRQLLELNKKLDYTENYIQWWFRKRRAESLPTKMTKFTETGWRFTFYTLILSFGIYVLYDKPWVTATVECWRDFPKQSLTRGMYWYYMIELGFYNSLIVSYMFDVKRKDFVEQMLHHLATVFLISFSWFANFLRIGTLVMCLHDMCDPWLEGAKLGIYTKNKLWSDSFFGMFAFLWLVTRIIIFPLYILNSTWYEAVATAGYAPSVYFFNAALFILLCLHVFWFQAICQVLVNALMKGEVEDSRSDSEGCEEEEPVDSKPVVKNLANGGATNGKQAVLAGNGSGGGKERVDAGSAEISTSSS